MREYPISFYGDMVRAIPSGRKTQTRRVVKPQPERSIIPDPKKRKPLAFWIDGEKWDKCPYGVPGDRLWVRESWAHCKIGRDITDEYYSRSVKFGEGDHFAYRADGDDSCFIGPWRPSSHMPREASRITLEVTGVRVERLQDISSADLKAEGCRITEHPQGLWTMDGKKISSDAYGAFADYWDSIYAKRGFGWDANPWVWVIEFRRIENA